MKPACNIVKCQCELIIPPGYERCFECGGLGCFIKGASFKQHYIIVSRCTVCNGEGIVDWVTSTTKKPPLNIYFWSSFRIYFKCGGKKKCKFIKTLARTAMK